MLLVRERDDRATLSDGGGLAGIIVQVIAADGNRAGLSGDGLADFLMRNRGGL